MNKTEVVDLCQFFLLILQYDMSQCDELCPKQLKPLSQFSRILVSVNMITNEVTYIFNNGLKGGKSPTLKQKFDGLTGKCFWTSDKFDANNSHFSYFTNKIHFLIIFQQQILRKYIQSTNTLLQNNTKYLINGM